MGTLLSAPDGSPEASFRKLLLKPEVICGMETQPSADGLLSQKLLTEPPGSL